MTASYDGSRPHMRVMGIDHVYVAPPAPGQARRLRARPPDAQTLGPEFPAARAAPPKVALTLARMGGDGVARPSTNGIGAPRLVRGDARVMVDDFAFRPAHLTVGRGAIVRWRFAERGVKHDVTVAAGPRGFGSPWRDAGGRYGRRFSEPGTYLLQCSLHAATMSQVVHVRQSPLRPLGADPLPR